MNIAAKNIALACSLAISGTYSLSVNAADTPVPKGELQKLVSGKTVMSAGASLYYGSDGSYTYNGASPGKYRIDTGRICVDFANGQARCDNIVKDAGKYYLINAQGRRFQFAH
jgi:hypothetical protein